MSEEKKNGIQNTSKSAQNKNHGKVIHISRCSTKLAFSSIEVHDGLRLLAVRGQPLGKGDRIVVSAGVGHSE